MNESDFEELRAKAEQGDAEAQFLLGKHYDGRDSEEAIRWYRLAAGQGHAGAQNNLGTCLSDKDEAAKWYRLAAENGSAAAQYNLGMHCLNCDGDDVAADLREAFKWLRAAAEQGREDARRELRDLTKVEREFRDVEQGDAEAMFRLGLIFMDYVLPNRPRAFRWILKAAENGCREAQFRAGTCYAGGYGVQEDSAEAFKWFGRAAEHGHPEAMKILCRKAEFDLMRTAAENGDAESQFHLGEFYKKGHGVRQSDTEAVEWIRRAADQGLAAAQFVCSECCPEGSAESIEWLRKAAGQGFAKAQLELGRCFQSGEGVEKDEAAGAEWIRKAAEQGLVEAQLELARCYQAGCGVKQDSKAAFEWLEKADDQHDPDARFQVGLCYYYGIGVEQDYSVAFECFLAAISGRGPAVEPEINWRGRSASITRWTDKNPMDMLCECYQAGHGVKRNLKRAINWNYYADRARGIIH